MGESDNTGSRATGSLNAVPPKTGSLLSRVHYIVVAIAVASNVLGAFVLLSLVVIMNIDVISRGVFNAPFRGVVEIVIFSLVLIVFLQLPDVVRTGRLTRSDGFLVLLDNRRTLFSRWLSRRLRQAINIASCIFMFFIVWTVWPQFLESFSSCHFFVSPASGVSPTGSFWVDFMTSLSRCHYFGTPGILTAPWWPLHLVTVFGTGLAGILFLFRTLPTFDVETGRIE